MGWATFTLQRRFSCVESTRERPQAWFHRSYSSSLPKRCHPQWRTVLIAKKVNKSATCKMGVRKTLSRSTVEKVKYAPTVEVSLGASNNTAVPLFGVRRVSPHSSDGFRHRCVDFMPPSASSNREISSRWFGQWGERRRYPSGVPTVMPSI